MLASIIIIPHKNRENHLLKSLPTIFNQTHKDLEIILVDAGTDKVLEAVQKFKVNTLNLSQASFNNAHAFNEGVKLTKGEVLINLSADVIPGTNQWLSFLLENFKDPKVGVVFGKPQPYLQDSLLDQIFLKTVIQFLFGNERKIFDAGTAVAGGNMALRKSLWEIFPFDELLSRAEDNLFVGQIHKAGYLSVYEPRAWVYHNHGVFDPLVDIFRNLGPFLKIRSRL